MPLKQQLKSLIGDKNLGIIDYFLRPEYKKLWGGSFNGQTFRRQMFNDICDNYNFTLIVETGSYVGNTTAFLAEHGLPVLTVEYDRRKYGYLSARFCLRQSIKVFENDSRAFLKQLRDESNVSKDRVFFYLDAHWNEDLPLAEELEIIFSTWNNAIVMIDDFNVPDTNYGYDDYGIGKALNLDYVSKVPGSDEYEIFFPSVAETEETGKRRGSVILCKDLSTLEALNKCQSLRNYKITE